MAEYKSMNCFLSPETLATKKEKCHLNETACFVTDLHSVDSGRERGTGESDVGR